MKNLSKFIRLIWAYLPSKMHLQTSTDLPTFQNSNVGQYFPTLVFHWPSQPAQSLRLLMTVYTLNRSGSKTLATIKVELFITTTNIYCLTIDQCLCYPFVLKSWSLTVSMSSSLKIIFSTRINQDSGLMTLAYIILLPLHITFSVLLMLTFYWKFVAFSSIYLKHSIEFAMKASFINSKIMELTVTTLNLLNHF